MLDAILPWLVLVVPVVLGAIVIAVPAKHENVKGHMRWRYALGVCLILYAGLVGWQQSRERATSAKERQKAVQETVTETSKQVTATVTDQFKQTVADQKAQITDLQNKLAVQASDLKAIRSSNIVSGKNPVKVEVTNQPNETGQHENLPSLNWTQEMAPPANGHARTMVRFSVGGPINLPGFIAVCDRPCKEVTGMVTGFSNATSLSRPGSPNVAGVFFSQPKPFPAGIPAVLVVESMDDQPVKISNFRILREAEIPIELK